jgi:hypothetical protein
MLQMIVSDDGDDTTVFFKGPNKNSMYDDISMELKNDNIIACAYFYSYYEYRIMFIFEYLSAVPNVKDVMHSHTAQEVDSYYYYYVMMFLAMMDNIILNMCHI